MKSSNVTMMFCLFFLAWAFYVNAMPSVHVYQDHMEAGTFYGRQLPPKEHASATIMEVQFDTEHNVLEYIKGKIVTVAVDGEKKSFITEAETAMDLINKLKIVLQPLDEVSLSLQEPLENGDQLSIKRIHYRDSSKVVQIPYNTVHHFNDWVYQGLKVVWQMGEHGKKKQYFRERFEDGKSVSKALTKEEIIVSPTEERIAHGTLIFDGTYVKKLPMLASSYNPTVEQCGPNPFVTYSGLRVRYGIVATDPKVIPLGTWLYVSGYGYALAADIGGAIKGNRIDCFFFTSHVGSGWRGGHIYVFVLEGKPEGGR